MSPTKEVSWEVFPYLRLYKDGTVERLEGTQVTPPGLDPETGVLSKDITIQPETSLRARVYRPDSIKTDQKLPLVIYFHGGAFVIATPGEPKYHRSLNDLVNEANVVALSVDYRLAPEHPLPAAYEDSWCALKWVSSHLNEGDDALNKEDWLLDYVDFERVFLAGDSAGANIAHHLGFKLGELGELKVNGMVMINPYFWGKQPVGVEAEDHLRRPMVDNWVMFVCPNPDKGCDDPFINPFLEEGEGDSPSPGLEGLACDRVIVFVSEKDILCDRGKMYYEKLVGSGWKGKAEIVETKGEDHVFHIFNPGCDNALALIKKWASFVNRKE